MSIFPILKTGVMAQYPMGSGSKFETGVLRFLDGSEQRFRSRRRGARRWKIALDLLSESECREVEIFVDSLQGAQQEFQFTDPLSGVLYPRCRLASGEVVVRLNGAHHGQTSLEIHEVED